MSRWLPETLKCRWVHMAGRVCWGEDPQPGQDGGKENRKREWNKYRDIHSSGSASCSAPNFHSYLNSFCDCPFLFQDLNHSQGQCELTAMLKRLRETLMKDVICFRTCTSYCLFQAHFWFHCVLLRFGLMVASCYWANVGSAQRQRQIITKSFQVKISLRFSRLGLRVPPTSLITLGDLAFFSPPPSCGPPRPRKGKLWYRPGWPDTWNIVVMFF